MGSRPKKIGRIELTAEKKTLLITLYAKAADYRSKRSLLNDKMAYEIASRLDHDHVQVNEWGHDDLGCGLDSRVSRIDPPSTVSWFDLDYPDVC